ncbi:unnamed protein product [Oikopleura dioica]|uniref:Uncharacterized protein n=1 Tax=Oikopleura dioica TaxID=34765 RepID=E4Y501_OIKDI|nr:unnamed protein product [Oikopleura dioica]
MASRRKRIEKRCNKKTQFQCFDSHGDYCITREWVCDRVPDCENGADEVDCGDEDSSSAELQDEVQSKSNEKCPEFMNCVDGKCVEESSISIISDRT